MILLTGATGLNGREVARLLSEQGVAAKALARNPEKITAMNLAGITPVVGDFDQPQTLEAALKGVETAFLLTPYAPNQAKMQKDFIAAARCVGVRHIVKFSGMGADPASPVGIFQQHGEAEKALEQSGLQWTHLRPVSFMQNFLSNAATIAQGALYAPMEQARVNFVDVRDIAAVAVKALTEPGHEGKSYEITGPEALTHTEIAAQLGEAVGREVAYVPVTPEQFAESLRGFGAPDWLITGVNELYAAYRAGAADTVTFTVERVGGKPPIPFAQFARDYAAALSGR